MVAGAGVFGALAFSTGGKVELEAEVDRFGVGGLLELHDDVVAFSVRQLRLAHERVAFLLELKGGLAALGIGNVGDGLRRHRHGLHLFVVEVDGDGAVFLDHELCMRLGFVE